MNNAEVESKPKLTTLEAICRLALIEGQKESTEKGAELSKTFSRRMLGRKAALNLSIYCAMLLLVPIVSMTTVGRGLSSAPIPALDNDGVPYYGNVTGYEVLNTTNTDAVILGEAWKDVDNGPIPVNVLIIADEEARHDMSWADFWQGTYDVPWWKYAIGQIERGDEKLVSDYGIDMRVVGYISDYNSNNSLADVSAIWSDMKEKIGWRLNYKIHLPIIGDVPVDVLFCITGQRDDYPALCDTVASVIVAAHNTYWQMYWADDNLAQHELSHLFGCHDHANSDDPSYSANCIMSYRTEYITYVSEDGLWLVFSYVGKCYITHSYCDVCDESIEANKYKFPIIKHSNDPSPGGEIIPIDRAELMVKLIAPYVALVSAVSINFAIVRRKMRR